ncbi:PREDICTED: uncharacterized protein LOC104815685 [Tarenaya hassleriana]|uniref:uncharacterized protein LOC104815685 n=1 Tax=Tarenaya hassleriana TaxID=28532 RepID=UPI00053C1536|nr:PREDICTED: uncharacterized protein LOC104815685 [Tarenaya hassleriana]
MRQRIVLKVAMTDSPKSRSKAMKIASGTSGVRSVSIQGENDQLVVLGEEIDTVELTRELRKKVGHAKIVTVQAAPPPPLQQNEPPRRCHCEIPNSGFCEFCRNLRSQALYYTLPPPPPPPYYGVCRDTYSDGCSVM